MPPNMIANQEQEASNRAAMSRTEAVTCKLPLLDGERDLKSRIIAAEVELQHAGTLHELCAQGGDKSHLNDILCTAWGLLLRCYTGQDDIVFQFRQTNSDGERSSGVRMAFHEQESLSTHIERARQDNTEPLELRRPHPPTASSNAHSTPGSSDSNTTLWVQEVGSLDTPVNDFSGTKVRERLSYGSLTQNRLT